ncbi:hypothetical protein MNBD_NITROSPINAE01-1303 [hydrothermal vent metagenome]|uniref:YkgJ family cysteine cluster protein n=1 Tax=hydrothermal vent metagenome TaxID=652676 RepID=A0A3B1C3J4_9ZZZZ
MAVKMTVDGCQGCPGKCCSDLEEQIIKPRTKADIENLKWQLHFENTHVFIRNKRWYQLTLGKCMYLADDFHCTIYEDRPEVCRSHMPPECEHYGEIYDVILRTPEDFMAHIVKEDRRKKKIARAKKQKTARN